MNKTIREILGFLFGVGLAAAAVLGWHYWHIHGFLAVCMVLIGVACVSYSLDWKG